MIFSGKRSLTVPVVALICLAAVSAARVSARIPFFERLHLKTYNAFFSSRGPQPADSTIVLVLIDEVTLQNLSAPWPYAGSFYARAVRNLRRAGARLIVFDLEFFETNAARPDEDFEFAHAIHDGGRVLIGGKIVFEISASGSRKGYLLRPNPWLEEVADSWGLLNLLEDSDGYVRRYPLTYGIDGRFYYPLALEALRLLEDPTLPEEANRKGAEFIIGKYRIPKSGGDAMFINFSGPPGKTFATYSFIDVIGGKAGADTARFDELLRRGAFREKIVFIGASAPALGLVRRTPFRRFEGKLRERSEAEIHAQALSTIRSESLLKPVDPFAQWILLVVAVLLALWTTVNMSLRYSALAAALLLAVMQFAALSLFVKRGLVLDLTSPYLGVVFCFAGAALYQTLRRRKEQEAVRSLYSRCAAPSVIEKMLAERQLPPAEAVRRTVTLLFCRFENLAEYGAHEEPGRLVDLYSEVISAIITTIFDHRGSVYSVFGSQLVAVFGAPLPLEDHAERACRAALQIGERLNRRRQVRKGEEGLRIGMAVHSGDVIIAGLGGKHRFECTILGKDVELVERLEAANRIYKTTLIASETAFEAVEGKLTARELDRVRAGAGEPALRIYELLPTTGGERRAIYDDFAEGLRLYRNRAWGEALKAFRRVLRTVPEDGPALLFTARCLDCLESPPPPEWDDAAVIN